MSHVIHAIIIVAFLVGALLVAAYCPRGVWLHPETKATSTKTLPTRRGFSFSDTLSFMIFNKKVLKNGLRLITVPMKDTATVTVLILVETGSKYETKNISGLSHFLEHMCFKGTKKRPSAQTLSTELDSIGAEYNAFTSQEYTGYYAKAHKKHVDKILDVVSDLYQNQRFEESEIEREKGVIIEEINMYEDMPQRKVGEVLMEALYGDQPAAWSIAGTKETVSAMKREDFISYVKDHYVASATVVVVSGAYNESTIESDVEKAFADLSTGAKKGKEKVIEAQTEAVVRLQKKPSDQTHMILVARSYPVESDKNYALNVLAGVLGKGMSSRLFQLLREKMGVCYYVRAGVDPYTDHGVFEISAGIDTARVEEVLAAIMKELKRFTTELVPADELTKVKEYITGKTALSLESSDSFADYVGFQEIFHRPIKAPEESAEKIQAVTAEDIRAIAIELIKPGNLTLAMVSPYDKPENLKKILES